MKTIPAAEFVKSCSDVSQAPKPPLAEIAFAGRSNVGKSSLINSLLNRKGLALTSQTPGKTRLLNYYRIGKGDFYFVDLPGYGFAKVGRAMQKEWAKSLEDYIGESPRLELVILILDIRRGLTDLDSDMVQALNIYRRHWLVAATKSDKLTKQEKMKAMRDLEGMLISLGAEKVIAYSASTHEGREELWQAITG